MDTLEPQTRVRYRRSFLQRLGFSPSSSVWDRVGTIKDQQETFYRVMWDGEDVPSTVLTFNV